MTNTQNNKFPVKYTCGSENEDKKLNSNATRLLKSRQDYSSSQLHDIVVEKFLKES